MIVLAGLGLVQGAPLPALAVAVAAVAWPLPTAAVLLLLAAREAGRRRPDTRREVAALVAVAAELRGGAGLRHALATGAAQLPAGEVVGRLALAGRPLAEVAPALERALGRHGPLAASALRLAGRVGGPLAPLFEELATQAIDLEEVARERRAAMAPALMQGAVVGGIPVLAVLWMGMEGRLTELAASGPVGALLVAAGLLLTWSGVAAVALMVWRSGR